MSHSSIATKSVGLDILRSVATFEASKRRESQFNNLGDFLFAPTYNDRALLWIILVEHTMRRNLISFFH